MSDDNEDDWVSTSSIPEDQELDVPIVNLAGETEIEDIEADWVDEEQSPNMNDQEEIVREREPETPPGFAGAEDSESDLNEEVLRVQDVLSKYFTFSM